MNDKGEDRTRRKRIYRRLETRSKESKEDTREEFLPKGFENTFHVYRGFWVRIEGLKRNEKKCREWWVL